MKPRIGFNGDNPLCLFGFTPKQLFGLRCNADDEFEWTIISQPIGSAVTISDDSIQNPTWLPDIAGEYVIGFCCTEFLDTQLPDDYAPPSGQDLMNASCPKGAMAGETIRINFPCAGQVDWVVNGVPVTSYSGDTTGVTIITDPTTGGPITVTANCTENDANGNPVTTPYNCTFNTWLPADITQCQLSAAVPVEFELCGTRCRCATPQRFIIKEFNPAEECLKTTLCLTVKKCPPTVEEECP